MKDTHTILTGIDFSESSAHALKGSARLARRDGARLIALHVLERDFSELLRTHLKLDEAAVLQRARERLEAFVEDNLGQNPPVDCEITVGQPFERFLEAVEKFPADLLVLGSEGLTQDKREMGMIASKCVRKIPVPVLLVSEFQDQPFRKIVLCTDFSATSQRALEYAVDIAVADRASLEILHVMRPVAELLNDMGTFTQPLPKTADYGALMRKSAEHSVAPFRDRLQGIPLSIEIVERIGISDAIIDHLERSGADLVVLGTRGRTGLKKLFLGTTAEKVLRAVPCSALAVKPEGWASR